MTNKRNATKQIGRHMRRLEQAQLAAERHKLKGSSGAQDVNEFLDQDLETRYQVSHSRNDPVNIYTYIRANRDDPAFNVCPLAKYLVPAMSS